MNKKQIQELTIKLTGKNYLLTTNKYIVKMCKGDLTVAMLFSQLSYWNDKKLDVKWIYKTDLELASEIGTTKKRISRAKVKLKELGLVEVKVMKRGNVPTTHYSVNTDKFIELFTKSSELENDEKGISKSTKSVFGNIPNVDLENDVSGISTIASITTSSTTYIKPLEANASKPVDKCLSCNWANLDDYEDGDGAECSLKDQVNKIHDKAYPYIILQCNGYKPKASKCRSCSYDNGMSIIDCHNPNSEGLDMQIVTMNNSKIVIRCDGYKPKAVDQVKCVECPEKRDAQGNIDCSYCSSIDKPINNFIPKSKPEDKPEYFVNNCQQHRQCKFYSPKRSDPFVECRDHAKIDKLGYCNYFKPINTEEQAAEVTQSLTESSIDQQKTGVILDAIDRGLKAREAKVPKSNGKYSEETRATFSLFADIYKEATTYSYQASKPVFADFENCKKINNRCNKNSIDIKQVILYHLKQSFSGYKRNIATLEKNLEQFALEMKKHIKGSTISDNSSMTDSEIKIEMDRLDGLHDKYNKGGE